MGHVLQLGLGATGAHIDGDTHSHGPAMATPRVLGARCSEQARKPLKHDLPTALTLPGYPEQTQRIGRTSLTDGPIFLLDGEDNREFGAPVVHSTWKGLKLNVGSSMVLWFQGIELG